MISIVIPLFNKANQIAQTINSVLSQTFMDFEIIIVDDGSTDDSIAEVQKFDDGRIRVIHQKNSGVSAARNRGIKEAKYDLIAFLDADDEWKPDYLDVQYRLSQQYPECSVFACNYEFHNPNGEIIPTIIRKLPFKSDTGILTNYFEVASVSHPPICSISVMVRKSAIENIGGFPFGIKSGEDLLTWARLAANYKIAYSRKALAIFNIEGYNFSDKPKRIPPEFDYVGNELEKLRQQYPSSGLRKYNAQWHKMRSAIFLRLSMKKQSIQEAFIGLKYNPMNFKLYAYIILNLLPNKIRKF